MTDLRQNDQAPDAPRGASFTDIAEIVYLTPETCTFSCTENGFLTLISTVDRKPETLFDGEEAPPRGGHGDHGHHGQDNHPPRGGKHKAEIKYTPDGRRDYGRVILHRAFPFDRPDNIISVQQEDGFEIGVISDIRIFPPDVVAMLEKYLDNRYFIPEIKRILSAKDKYGFVYFKCDTNCGITEFVVKNPLGSIIRASDTRFFIVDVDGCRYAIPDVTKLDKKSYRKIELYI